MLAFVNSPFGWPGGKRALTRTLLALIPSHELYAEVFLPVRRSFSLPRNLRVSR